MIAFLLPIASAFAPVLKVQPQDPRHSWVNRRTREISSAEVNVGLVRQLTLNQLLIGWTIWSGGEGAAVLARDAHFDSLLALPLGVLGVLPLIFISRKIERSESGVVADLNLSTNLLVLRLFGSEKQPVLALAASLFLACLTGLVEETTFRGEILPSLAQGNGLAGGVSLSTALFAALHVNPKAPLEGSAPSRRLPRNLAPSLAAGAARGRAEHRGRSGATFALLYVMSGNLAVPILAHSLYDCYTFYGTHLEIQLECTFLGPSSSVAGQMEYAKAQALMPSLPGSSGAAWRQRRGEAFLQSAAESAPALPAASPPLSLLPPHPAPACTGVVSRKELRIALYSYGVRLSGGESAAVLRAADADESGGVDFSEFLEFVGPSGDAAAAIKRALLGVR
ncbi:putative abortive infection protein [Emiliania huxleyi CCMP1516]|uniref:EF-hand domain-containing protein n=2 Tax=Emiliania huxleyi TaxID=2903 RepID=A0A0D3IRF3_EMIH1|nr:putative abortive infection protein [Emiliania huxleyi CCMP1516]EOD13838.1 putative abortive infection protein [Emiliania huxleyi CCMP1516]|eukprot:XP_005766267.1 putative abortive infection protein [Emiliania huxleyi CCMP1516]